MHLDNLHLWQHDHSFGQEQKRAGESRTVCVIALTATMMVVEIAAGLVYGSMALLADGLHMASHAAALAIAAFAYVYARRHAHDRRFSFGTGKVNSLGGFSGALLLAVFAVMMAWESCARLVSPVPIAYNQAILVAVLGLLVNGASVFILGHEGHGHEHGHEHDQEHVHESHAEHEKAPIRPPVPASNLQPESDRKSSRHHHHDHNLRAAYLHVMADALTSLLAIFALLAAKYYAANWMDPFMGIVGAVLVSRWSLGLLRTTSRTLLDRQADDDRLEQLKASLEHEQGLRVADLHLWSIGPDIYAAEIRVVTHQPKAPEDYRALIPPSMHIVHATFEVCECRVAGRQSGDDVSMHLDSDSKHAKG